MVSTVMTELVDGRRLVGRVENGMVEPGELEDKLLCLTREGGMPSTNAGSVSRTRKI